MEPCLSALLNYQNHEVVTASSFESHGFNFVIRDTVVPAMTILSREKVVAKITPDHRIALAMKTKHEQLIDCIHKIIPQKKLDKMNRIIATYFYVKKITVDIVDQSYIQKFSVFFNVNGFIIEENVLKNFQQLEIQKINSNHEFLEYDQEVKILEMYKFI